MSLQSSSLIRSSRKRIFESHNDDSITISRNLSTNTPNGKLEQLQYVKTSQFSLNTPVNSSIQETDFQAPIQSQFKQENTPSFNKKNNNPIVRKDLSKYLEESGQLRIDEGQFDSVFSSEESFEQQQNTSQRYSYINQQAQSSKIQQIETPIVPKTIVQSEESENSLRIVEKVQQPRSQNSQIMDSQSINSTQKDISMNPKLEESHNLDQIQIKLSEVQQSISQQDSKSNQSNWQFNELEQLIKGFEVTKFCRSEFFGKKKRLLQITPDLKLIIFRNTDHQITKIYSINKIRKIEKGSNTETFKKYNLKPEQQCYCFSIFLDERTVDVSFSTQESLEYALDCLSGLIQSQ